MLVEIATCHKLSFTNLLMELIPESAYTMSKRNSNLHAFTATGADDFFPRPLPLDLLPSVLLP